MDPPKKTYSERELPNNLPIRISLPDGKLNPESIGWTRKPVQVSNLRGYALRKKRWNYWCVVTPDCLFSVTLSNVDYLGLAFAYFLDFKSRRFTEKTVMTMFGKGCDLPETVEGAVNFNHPDMKLSFDDRGSSVEISVECADFGGQKLEAHLMVERPAGLESLNIIIPWSSTRYHYTSKQNCLPAGGTVTVGADSYAVDLQRDFACLDFGRGIWKYHSFWNWSSFSTRTGAGTVGAAVIGANLGAGWTDDSGTTENSLLINGRLEKIGEDVIFDYDPLNFMAPWHLKTTFSNQVDLTFTPFYERVSKTEAVILRSEVHQMIGKFNGTVASVDGRQFTISEVVGWAEEHHARW